MITTMCAAAVTLTAPLITTTTAAVHVMWRSRLIGVVQCLHTHAATIRAQIATICTITVDAATLFSVVFIIVMMTLTITNTNSRLEN